MFDYVSALAPIGKFRFVTVCCHSESSRSLSWARARSTGLFQRDLSSPLHEVRRASTRNFKVGPFQHSRSDSTSSLCAAPNRSASHVSLPVTLVCCYRYRSHAILIWHNLTVRSPWADLLKGKTRMRSNPAHQTNMTSSSSPISVCAIFIF